MDSYHVAGILLSMFTLPWSKYPFINLIYAMVVIRTVGVDQFNVVTGSFLCSMVVAHLAKSLESDW